jgi:dienelactone hydrolase
LGRDRERIPTAAAAGRFRRQSPITLVLGRGDHVAVCTDVLILIGKNDTWTPADLCLKTVAARAKDPRPPAIKVYPGAVHSFDLGSLPVVTSSGHMVGGNPEAAADSFAMTKAFLDARLKVK